MLLAMTYWRLIDLLMVIQYFYEIDFGMKYRALEVVNKQQVAAASDMKHRTSQLFELDVHKIRYRIILDETARLHLHSEGVHLGEILVVFCLYHSLIRFPIKPEMTGPSPVGMNLQLGQKLALK